MCVIPLRNLYFFLLASSCSSDSITLINKWCRGFLLYHETIVAKLNNKRYTSIARWDAEMTGAEPTCDGKTGDVPVY